MDKIRIFQFPLASNSGVKQYALNNWKHLAKNRFVCDFGTVQKRLSYEEEIYGAGAGIKYISSTAEGDPERFYDEIWKLLHGNYDVVHLHTSYWRSFLVEEIAMACQIPKVIVHSHSTGVDLKDDVCRQNDEEIHALRKEEFQSSLATDLCACSWRAADWLFGEHIPRSSIQILKNAIEVDRFLFQKPVREALRKKMGLEDCFVVGHVGRFCYQKNHSFLLDTFSEVNRRIPNARLLLVGDGPLEDAIKAQAQELGIAEHILFTGLRADVHALLQVMDVFCLPSFFEGLPISLIEAQTAGLRCLISDLVSGEACICSNVAILPLHIERWMQALLDIAKGYERENMYNCITSAGYNIEYQIKEVERLYTY